MNQLLEKYHRVLRCYLSRRVNEMCCGPMYFCEFSLEIPIFAQNSKHLDYPPEYTIIIACHFFIEKVEHFSVFQVAFLC